MLRKVCIVVSVFRWVIRVFLRANIRIKKQMRAYKLDYFTSDLGIFFPAFPFRSLSSVTAGLLLLQFQTSETLSSDV